MNKLDKINMLTFLEFTTKDKHGKNLASFLCDCGNVSVKVVSEVRTGRTKSCGCLKIKTLSDKNKKHGKSKTKQYSAWQSMIQRCTNPSSISYKYYGALGITVCDRWLNSFEAFYEDMGERPKGMSLDRIDVNGNYCPENCRWVIPNIQTYNQNQRCDNTSGTSGVYFNANNGRWYAEITIKGKKVHLGSFLNIEDAIKVRKDSEIQYYNFSKPETNNAGQN